MKSKFLSLAKIKEQSVEQFSSDIASVSSKIILQKEKIKELKSEFFNKTSPKEGSIRFFAQKQLLNIAYKQELNSLEFHLNQLLMKEENLQEKIKLEQIEFEKFNLLHKEELRKKLNIIKQKENTFMDEMGSVGFVRNGNVF